VSQWEMLAGAEGAWTWKGTSAADDIEMNNLLEELELVLAQIVGLSRNNCARDMAWIRQGLQERSTIDRLRTVSAGKAI
jgi:hypothetical protein